jgi:hypothetical protein
MQTPQLPLNDLMCLSLLQAQQSAAVLGRDHGAAFKASTRQAWMA